MRPETPHERVSRVLVDVLEDAIKRGDWSAAKVVTAALNYIEIARVRGIGVEPNA